MGNAIENGKTVGPYVGVTKDEIRDFKEHGKFRLLIYGAYNAHGLIGSECNGICVLDENKKAVLADELVKASTGYFGPSEQQVKTFEDLMNCPWVKFRACVNKSGRARYQI